MNDLLHELERLTRTYGGHPFFYLQGEGPSQTYSYAQANLAAAALARELGSRGAHPGSCVVSRLYNGPELILLTLAAAYGGFDLALVNPRLSHAKRSACLAQVDAPVLMVEEHDFPRLLLDACGRDFAGLTRLDEAGVASLEASLGLKAYSELRLNAFAPKKTGVILFAESDEGPKAVSLSWERVTASAKDANEQLGADEDTTWQLVLPLCHVDGFQVLVRSLMNDNPFIVYTNYNTTRILNDVLPFKVTHISVVEPILRDLVEHDRDAILSQYRCILLGGGTPASNTLRAAGRAGVRVVVANTKQADLIKHGHELGLDCSYDETYISIIPR